MKMRSRSIAACTALVSITGLTALSACGSSSGTTSAGKAGKAPVTIGVSVSLTGDFSDSGKDDLRGYQLWQQEINKSGGLLGRRVKLIYADDGSSPNHAVSNYETFITKDHVNLVFGPFSTLLTAPSVLIAERYGYAFPDPADGAPQTLSEHPHNFFLMQPASPLATGVVFAKWILSLPKSQRPKTAAYATLQDPFLTPATQLVQKMFKKAGIRTVYYHVYGTENIQMQPIVAAMAAAHPQVVIGGTMEADSFAMTSAMVQAHFNPKYLFFMNGPSDPSTYPQNVGLKNTSGVFSSIGWYPQEKTPGNAQFVSAYVKKYGGTAAKVPGDSAEAYTVGQVMAEVINKLHTLNNSKIIAALHAHPWPSMQGTLSWNSVGSPLSGLLLVEWIKGSLDVVWPPSHAIHTPLYPKPPWPGT